MTLLHTLLLFYNLLFRLTSKFIFTARLHGSGKYQTIKGEALVGINSNSVLAKYPSGRPVHWILFHELQCNNEDIPECYDVSWIDPRWIVEAAPHIFKKMKGGGRSGSGVGGGSLYFHDRYKRDKRTEEVGQNMRGGDGSNKRMRR